MLLLNVVLPETVLSPICVKEYAPKVNDIPPPYTFAPKETDEEKELINGDAALQLVNVLLEMV